MDSFSRLRRGSCMDLMSELDRTNCSEYLWNSIKHHVRMNLQEHSCYKSNWSQVSPAQLGQEIVPTAMLTSLAYSPSRKIGGLLTVDDRTATSDVRTSTIRKETFGAIVREYWSSLQDSQHWQKRTDTWFRFLIKQIVKQPLPNEKDYRWYKFNIFTRWFPNGESIILSFDTPPVLRPQILQMLDHGTPKQDPYWVHLKFLHEMVALQDQAVWSVRNVVRETELVSRLRPSK